MGKDLNRVIHIVPAVTNEASGPSYSVVRLCEALIAQQQNITLAALDWAPMASSHHFLQTFSMGSGPRRLGLSPAMREWIFSQADSNSLVLIHNHSLWMMPNVYPGQAARKYRIPLLVSPRRTLSHWPLKSGSWTKRIFWPLLQRPALSAATCFHATAEAEYKDIRRMGFRQPIAIIPNGIDIPDLQPKKSEKFRTVLFLGRIHPVKGLDILLRAWQIIQKRFPEWKLRIVGPDNGGYLANIKSLANELNLERIDFSGPLYGDAKFDAYREADLFVLPTHSENFGVAVAEALATGTPAIVTQGAPWEGLETQNCGWWIDIGVDALLACLEDALSRSQDELSAMGLRGREWMKAQYSWEQISFKMAAAYNWICNGGRRPSWIMES